MRKLFIAALFLLCFNTVSAQDKQAELVNQVIIKFFDGLSEPSEQKLKETTTKDFVLLEDGEVWNLDSLTRYFEGIRKAKTVRVNEFKFIKNQAQGNTAWVSYHNKATFTTNDKARSIEWLESAVLVKEGKEWKISLLHSTPIRRKKS